MFWGVCSCSTCFKIVVQKEQFLYLYLVAMIGSRLGFWTILRKNKLLVTNSFRLSMLENTFKSKCCKYMANRPHDMEKPLFWLFVIFHKQLFNMASWGPCTPLLSLLTFNFIMKNYVIFHNSLFCLVYSNTTCSKIVDKITRQSFAVKIICLILKLLFCGFYGNFLWPTFWKWPWRG